jgi:hypothetical protein
MRQANQTLSAFPESRPVLHSSRCPWPSPASGSSYNHLARSLNTVDHLVVSAIGQRLGLPRASSTTSCLLPPASCVFGSRSVLSITTTDRIWLLLNLRVLPPTLAVNDFHSPPLLVPHGTRQSSNNSNSRREHHFPFQKVHF